MRILLLEPDHALANFLRKGLQAEAYTVDTIPDQQSVLAQLAELDYDLLIFDARSEEAAMIRRVRAQSSDLPILALVATPLVKDRIQALESGADVCLAKPFSFSELSAYVRTLLGRYRFTKSLSLQVDDLVLDRVERRVERGGVTIEMTAKEFALLEYLMRNAGRRVTRAMILDNIWNTNFDTHTNVVDVYINYLRKKIDEPYKSKLIHTIRGVGYEIRPNEAILGVEQLKFRELE